MPTGDEREARLLGCVLTAPWYWSWWVAVAFYVLVGVKQHLTVAFICISLQTDRAEHLPPPVFICHPGVSFGEMSAKRFAYFLLGFCFFLADGSSPTRVAETGLLGGVRPANTPSLSLVSSFSRPCLTQSKRL